MILVNFRQRFGKFSCLEPSLPVASIGRDGPVNPVRLASDLVQIVC